MQTHRQQITVLLADDHMIVREGLRRLLEDEVDIQVVGEADTGRRAVELALALQPAVVVMDISMPLLNGMEATRQILHSCPAVRILILSGHAETAYIDKVRLLGAQGYMLKQTSSESLALAVRTIAAGKQFFSAGPAANHQAPGLKPPEKHSPPVQPAAPLTFREAEILQMIAEGSANKQMAAELGVSIKTIEKHRAQLMQRLNIHTTAGLTRYAMDTGSIERHVALLPAR